MSFKTLILTSYFTKKKHPQCADPRTIGLKHDGSVKNNSYLYIANWYESVVKNDLEAVVFHDGLDDYFIHKYSTKKIKFIKVTGEYHNYSLNDARFFYYNKFLISNKDFLDNYAVFMTDIADVKIVQNPAKLISCEYKFYAGNEEGLVLSDYISSFGGGNYFNVSKMFHWTTLDDYDLLNAGILGGKLEEVLAFLYKFCEERENAARTELNINMPLVNYLARILFGDDIYYGYPLNSVFKKYEDREDVYFIHK